MRKQWEDWIEESLHVAYGPEPPIQVIGRLEDERPVIGNTGFQEDLGLIHMLQEAAKNEGCEADAALTFQSSLVSWLCARTDVNPLPPHYFCPRCGRSEFAHEAKDCFDLPLKLCCEAPMLRRGHRIPFESVKESIRANGMELHIRLPRSFARSAAELIREYHEARGRYRVIPYERAEDWLLALIPRSDPTPEREELAEKDAVKLIKLEFSETKERMKEYRELSGRRPKTRELLDAPVLLQVKSRLEEQIRGAGKPQLRTETLSFSGLLAMLGYAVSVYSEDNPVLSAANARYDDLFTSREDVFELLRTATKPEQGIGTGFAAMIMKRTRQGKYAAGGMDAKTERLLRELGISDQWIGQMKHTFYLPAKADLIQRLTDELTLAWYELTVQ